MADSEKALRAAVLGHFQALAEAGFGGPFSIDVSARSGDSLLITPDAGSAPLRPSSIARMPIGGEYGAWRGPLKPSSEWRVHLDIARARPDVGAILRFQSPHATALAMARRAIPATHPIIALFETPVIRCANYAPAGAKDLAMVVLEALGGGHAALLGNRGALTTGATLEAAFVRAIELERLARLYAIALTVGRPAVLADGEVQRIGERLKASGATAEARAAPLGRSKTATKRQPAKSKRLAGKRRL